MQPSLRFKEFVHVRDARGGPIDAAGSCLATQRVHEGDGEIPEHLPRADHAADLPPVRVHGTEIGNDRPPLHSGDEEEQERPTGDKRGLQKPWHHAQGVGQQASRQVAKDAEPLRPPGFLFVITHAAQQIRMRRIVQARERRTTGTGGACPPGWMGG